MNDWHDLLFYGGTIVGGLGVALLGYRYWLWRNHQRHLHRLKVDYEQTRVQQVRGIPLDKLPIPTKENR